jgi:SAM-dependent methyltransferase
MNIVFAFKNSLKRNIRFNASRKVQFFRFGYNPSGYLRNDLLLCVFGNRNLYKHYQARKIFEALDIKSTDCALDFGCGTGYVTVEMAKLAESVVGLDICSSTENIPVPHFLKGKLQFLLACDNFFAQYISSFDVILLSEVLLSVPNRDQLLKHCASLLKTNGKLVLVNGLGKLFIKECIFSRIGLMSVLRKFFPNVPESYADYEKRLCSAFGNNASQFMGKDDIVSLLGAQGFVLKKNFFAPTNMIGNIMEWRQFYHVISKKKGEGVFGFIVFRLLFSVIHFFQKRSYPSGFIGVFQKKGAYGLSH